MPTSDTRNDPSTALWASLAGLALVFAIFGGNAMWLAPAFLLSGLALHKLAMPRPAKTIVLLACIAMAVGAIGLGLGKDMAVRDNALQAHGDRAAK